MAGRGTVRVSITGDKSGLDRATKGAEGSLNRLGRTGGKALRALGTAAKYGGAALAAGIGVGLKKSADAAIEEEKALARVRAQLRAVGQDTPKVRAELDKLITSQSRMSGFDDEDLLDSYTNLLRVTQDHSKAIELNSLAMDFARGKQMDVAKAGELIGKVAGGNIGILGRYGIKVKEGATATEALQLVQQRFAGQAKEYGQTTAGSMDRAKVATENLAEGVGRLLTPAIATGADALAGFVGGVEKGTGAGGQFRSTIEGGVGVLGRFVGQMHSGTGAGGQFRGAVESVIGTVRNLGGVVLPVVGFLGRAALAAGQFGLKLLGTKGGVVALHAVLGALIGRLAGLGVAWAIGRIVAFAGAVRGAVTTVRAMIGAATSARAATVALTGAMATNPWTALLSVVGLVAGALIGFTSEEKKSKVSSDQLSDALLEQRDALRAVRDLDIEAKDAKLRHKSASLAVTRAEDNLRAVRKQFGKGSLEAKEAEQQLREARLEQIRANRNLQDTEQKGKDTREKSTRATRDATNAARGRVSSLKSEIDELRLQIGLMGPFADKTEKGKAAQERLRAKERELIAAQRDLNAAIRAMPDRKVTYVDVIERHSRSDGRRPTKMVAPGTLPGSVLGFTPPPSGIGFARVLAGAAKPKAPKPLPPFSLSGGRGLGLETQFAGLDVEQALAEGTTGAEFGTPAQRGVADDIAVLEKRMDLVDKRIRTLRKSTIPKLLRATRSKARGKKKKGGGREAGPAQKARASLLTALQELAGLISEWNTLAAAVAELGGTTSAPADEAIDTGTDTTTPAPEPPPEPAPTTEAPADTGPTADEQAAIARLEEKLGIATRRGDIAGAAVRAFGSSPDIGTGKFANAYGAAVNVTIKTLVPTSPSTLKVLGDTVVGALGGSQGIVTAPRVATA